MTIKELKEMITVLDENKEVIVDNITDFTIYEDVDGNLSIYGEEF